jgi:predicted nuclease of predicted toxin-antitoxin system
VKVVIDMNLSVEWTSILHLEGLDAVHWREVGAKTDADVIILEWAQKNGAVILTQDLDFPWLLASTRATGPSVVLLRLRNELDPLCQRRIASIIQRLAKELDDGCLAVVDDFRERIKLLPLRED